MGPSPALTIGQTAPDFTLPDQNGNPVTLSSFKGKWVVVYFYPKAMTPGCTVQACALRDAKAELDKHGVVVLGISTDPLNALKQFEAKEHLNFSLLSDADHRISQQYGAWGEKNLYGKVSVGQLRQTFLVKPDGTIGHIMRKVNTKTHADDMLKTIDTLSKAAA